MSPDPSQQQSHHSSLHYHRCWWAFCRHSSYSIVELQEHINLEHVQNARPERLRDVPTHKLAEDDYWDSLDVSSPPHILDAPCPLQRASDQAVAGESTLLENILSSLPSPPASTPHPSSPASTPHQIPSTPPRIEPASVPVSPNTPVTLSFKSPAFVVGPPAPSSRRNFRALTPTFSSLRSQPNTPSGSNFCIPDSPPFGRLVEEAISAAKSARSASSCEGTSGGGNSSQESVFNQLTKTISDEENDIEEISSTKEIRSEEHMSVDFSPLHTNQRSPTFSHSSSLGTSHTNTMSSDLLVNPDLPSYPSSLASPIGIGTPMTRQSWYQGYRRQSHRWVLPVVPDSGPSPSLQRDTASPASPVPCPDVVHPSSPAISVVSPVSQSSPAINHSQCQKKPGQQMDSQLTTSYPPLLTQAPYHSQDMTQSQD